MILMRAGRLHEGSFLGYAGFAAGRCRHFESSAKNNRQYFAAKNNGQSPDCESSLPGARIARRGFYGTNTSCVEIAGGDEYVICDAGSGIQDLSRHIMTHSSGRA